METFQMLSATGMENIARDVGQFFAVSFLLGCPVVTAVFPLTMGLTAAVACWRRRAGPPRFLTGLLAAAALAAVIFLAVYPFWIPLFISIPAVAGIGICGVTAAASAFTRCRARLFRGTLLSCGIVAVCLLAWMDLRFCFIARTPDGARQEFPATGLILHRPGDFFVSNEYRTGKRLTKGVIHIGLFRWLEYKDDWHFSGAPGLQHKTTRWSEWPAEVMVPP
ncbi:MAG: hypothetical protein EOP88_02750 [Verrucomicrobiaceae bacterium]|nr:MAG: hypothetical protein EOP88_02750 [Verrucomicrobiaceae bacterium]